MAPVFYFQKVLGVSIYCLASFLVLSLLFCLRRKIPEIVALFILFLNLDVYALVFSFITGSAAGVELYPLILTGICYLLTYDMKKPKWLCPIFAVFSGALCLYINVFLKWVPSDLLPYSNDFYHYHHILTTMIVIGGFLLISVSYEIVLTRRNLREKARREELIYIANHDPLTGLMNRRRLWEHLHKSESLFTTENIPYVISIFDIDNFKRTNDTYGHACGDLILVEIAKLIKTNLPKDVKIGRWGGEEFVLLYKGYSDIDAINDIERLRSIVDNAEFEYLKNKIHITLTFGVSSSSYCDSAEHVIIDADKQLMKGKIQGKNRVVARNIQKSTSDSENDAIFDSIIDSSHEA